MKWTCHWPASAVICARCPSTKRGPQRRKLGQDRAVSRAGLRAHRRRNTEEMPLILGQRHGPVWSTGFRLCTHGGMTGSAQSTVQVAVGELGDGMSSLRLCGPGDRQEMRRSLSRLGQLTPVQAYRSGTVLEVFDGFKRLHAARELEWPMLRVEVHGLDKVGAKVRVLKCNVVTNLSELEEGWLVRSLYRDEKLSQPQIAMLLGCHKSWVCRRLALAECLSDEQTANVRLGLLSVTAVREVARLPGGNQDAVGQAVARRGLTTRQTAQLVDRLLGAEQEEWPRLLEGAGQQVVEQPRGGAPRRTPVEQLVADAGRMKQLASRLHARLLERSLESLGEAACATVGDELRVLGTTLQALTRTIDMRLATGGHRATQ